MEGAAGVAGLGGHADQLVEDRRDARAGSGAVQVGGAGIGEVVALELFVGLLEARDDQVVLGTEVVVERLTGDAGFGQQQAHTGGVIAMATEQAEGRIEQFLATGDGHSNF